MSKGIGAFFWFFVSTILYTYFGYPISIAMLSRLFPKKRLYKDIFPSTTLLIAAYNEEKIIDVKIRNCLEMTYPRNQLQIIVVADGSDDNTVEIANSYKKQNVEVLHKPERRGKMAAINRAFPYIRGEVIIFSDANNFYNSDTIQELVKPFSDPEVGAVSGAKTIIKGDGNLGASEGLYWKYEARIKEYEDRFSSCTSAAAEILAIRTSLFNPPPDHIINDDFYQIMLILRQGYRIAYAPKAKSYERISLKAEHEIKRRTRIISGRFQAIAMAHKILPFDRPIIVWQIISHKFLRPLAPFNMIGAYFMNLVAVLFPSLTNNDAHKKFFSLCKPYSTIFLSLQTLFYALAWVGRRLEDRGGDSNLKRIFYLPTFFVNSNIAALHGFIRFLQGKQTTLWERIPRRPEE
jgi:cellulose synthase/poly-beta-1,6-N-acetylglucosamine synthase-like glycosyltransferase